MAKSKHEKELARAKKKKDQRRRENEILANAAKFERHYENVFDKAKYSGKHFAEMINFRFEDGHEELPATALNAINAKLAGEARQHVNALAAVGESLYREVSRSYHPPIGSLIYQYPVEGDLNTIEVEPEPVLIQIYKEFDAELLSEALDHRYDAELVIWVTGLVSVKFHLAFCRDRNGTELVFVVDGETWYPIKSPISAREFLKIDTTILVESMEVVEGISMHEVFARLTELLGLNLDSSPPTGEDWKGKVMEVVRTNSQLIKASSNEIHNDFCMLAMRLYKKEASKTQPSDYSDPSLDRKSKPAGIKVNPEPAVRIVQQPLPPVIKPLSERLAAVLVGA